MRHKTLTLYWQDRDRRTRNPDRIGAPGPAAAGDQTLSKAVLKRLLRYPDRLPDRLRLVKARATHPPGRFTFRPAPRESFPVNRSVGRDLRPAHGHEVGTEKVNDQGGCVARAVHKNGDDGRRSG